MNPVNVPPPRNERHGHLAALCDAVSAEPSLGCGLVIRRGVTTLSVVRKARAPLPRPLVEVGCDYVGGTWWFVWADDAGFIAPVKDVAEAVDVVGRHLADLDSRGTRA
ncbi:hypothetical protein [Actinomadura kijaniata]|uniref:hypothetical protein n=1 Tax=Actinomadura kijaniata TaxID=46161 RepID=UPI00082C06ED|nr:hypothetical protein [Actinomadura kijaniata]